VDSNSKRLKVNPLQLGNGLQIGYAFVTKVNAAGSALVYSTYLGGSGGNQGNSIAVDSVSSGPRDKLVEAGCID
jgi:hypothetical protein